MYLSRLSTDQFRIFHQLTFPFNPHTNLIYGNNGAGKTTLLELLDRMRDIGLRVGQPAVSRKPAPVGTMVVDAFFVIDEGTRLQWQFKWSFRYGRTLFERLSWFSDAGVQNYVFQEDRLRVPNGVLEPPFDQRGSVILGMYEMGLLPRGPALPAMGCLLRWLQNLMYMSSAQDDLKWRRAKYSSALEYIHQRFDGGVALASVEQDLQASFPHFRGVDYQPETTYVDGVTQFKQSKPGYHEAVPYAGADAGSKLAERFGLCCALYQGAGNNVLLVDEFDRGVDADSLARLCSRLERQRSDQIFLVSCGQAVEMFSPDRRLHLIRRRGYSNPFIRFG